MVKGKLLCDVCDKPHDTLGTYPDCGEASVCMRCFGKADLLAYREDRWPNTDDLKRVREQMQARHDRR
jgi:hypothetical protein